MKYSVAQFWANCLNDLLSQKRYIVTDSFACRNYEPEPREEIFDTADCFEYEQNPGEGQVKWCDSSGIYYAGDDFVINADKRTITTQGKTGEGLEFWRVIYCPDGDRGKFNEWMRRSWK